MTNLSKLSEKYTDIWSGAIYGNNFLGTQGGVQIAIMANEGSVFKLVKFYCNLKTQIRLQVELGLDSVCLKVYGLHFLSNLIDCVFENHTHCILFIQVTNAFLSKLTSFFASEIKS